MTGNNKERFDFYVKAGIFKQETDVRRVYILANRLIDLLFKPALGKCEFVPDWTRIKKYGIDKNEPINWGDLKCNVEKQGNCFIITIDEASPGQCPSLCDYVEKHMQSWGWDVRCETEW